MDAVYKRDECQIMLCSSCEHVNCTNTKVDFGVRGISLMEVLFDEYSSFAAVFLKSLIIQ